MDDTTLQQQAEKIKEIYNDYVDQLLELKKKRQKIIMDFSQAIDNKAINKINNTLNQL